MTYLIEFRFQDKAKTMIRELIADVNEKCEIYTEKEEFFPHITIVAPFETEYEGKLLDDFNELCSKSPLMKFTGKGFNTFEENRVLYIDIKGDENLKKFRKALTDKLKLYCKLNEISFQKKYNFHSTIAKDLPLAKFNQVKDYIKTKPYPDFEYFVVRVTLLKDKKILKEFDFFQRKMLNREEAKDKESYAKTMGLLKDFE